MKFKCPSCGRKFRARTVPFCGRQVARCPCGGMVDSKDAVPARHPVRWIGRALTWPFRRKKTVRKFASGGIVSPKPVPVGIEPGVVFTLPRRPSLLRRVLSWPFRAAWGVVTWPWRRKRPRPVSIKAADEESAKNWFLSLSPAAAESLRKIRTKTWTMGDSRPFSRPWAPKVGEWVWCEFCKAPAKMQPDIGPTWNLLRSDCYHQSQPCKGGCVRPLALAEVQNEEQAQQFVGRKARAGECAPCKIIGFNSTDKRFRMMCDKCFSYCEYSAGMITLLPDSPAHDVEGIA